MPGIAQEGAVLRVGLVGAGPWATSVHAPMLAAGPETSLVAVWARREEAAISLAEQHGARAASSFAELLDLVDCVAFAVPPHVQAELAPRAAAAGRHLLLEKPLAGSLPDAVAVAGAVLAARVASMVLFTHRFSTPVRELLLRVVPEGVSHARVEHLSSAFLEGPFSRSPWRHEAGVVLDVGPHVLDLLLALMGPVEEVRARADGDQVTIELEHEAGTRSQAVLSAHVPGPGLRQLTAVAAGREHRVLLTPTAEDVSANVRSDFARSVRSGRPHPCDAARGLEVQRLLDRVLRQLD